LKLRILAKRMLIEIPFVFFAVLIPFATPGEKFEFLGKIGRASCRERVLRTV
jgi:hypothetical protein